MISTHNLKGLIKVTVNTQLQLEDERTVANRPIQNTLSSPQKLKMTHWNYILYLLTAYVNWITKKKKNHKGANMVVRMLDFWWWWVSCLCEIGWSSLLQQKQAGTTSSQLSWVFQCQGVRPRVVRRNQGSCMGESGLLAPSLLPWLHSIWVEADMPERHQTLPHWGVWLENSRLSHWCSVGFTRKPGEGVEHCIVSPQRLWVQDRVQYSKVQVCKGWTPAANVVMVLPAKIKVNSYIMRNITSYQVTFAPGEDETSKERNQKFYCQEKLNPNKHT